MGAQEHLLSEARLLLWWYMHCYCSISENRCLTIAYIMFWQSYFHCTHWNGLTDWFVARPGPGQYPASVPHPGPALGPGQAIKLRWSSTQNIGAGGKLLYQCSVHLWYKQATTFTVTLWFGLTTLYVYGTIQMGSSYIIIHVSSGQAMVGR